MLSQDRQRKFVALLFMKVPNGYVQYPLKAMRSVQQVKQFVEVLPEHDLEVLWQAVDRKVLVSLSKKVPGGQVHTPLSNAGPIEHVKHWLGSILVQVLQLKSQSTTEKAM